MWRAFASGSRRFRSPCKAAASTRSPAPPVADHHRRAASDSRRRDRGSASDQQRVEVVRFQASQSLSLDRVSPTATCAVAAAVRERAGGRILTAYRQLGMECRRVAARAAARSVGGGGRGRSGRRPDDVTWGQPAPQTVHGVRPPGSGPGRPQAAIDPVTLGGHHHRAVRILGQFGPYGGGVRKLRSRWASSSTSAASPSSRCRAHRAATACPESRSERRTASERCALSRTPRHPRRQMG